MTKREVHEANRVFRQIVGNPKHVLECRMGDECEGIWNSEEIFKAREKDMWDEETAGGLEPLKRFLEWRR